ncbi:MAG: hypothetical protein OEY73_04250 [Hadesarchaea archaeon]|nr:hypothetical protein [Hadesarchaea archaeon]
MGKRNYWTPRILLYNLIALILIAIILWVTGLDTLQGVIKLVVVGSLLLGSIYALRRFVLTSPPKWRVMRRGIFIFCGTFWIGFPLWLICVYSLSGVLSGDVAATISLLTYPLGAYLGDKLGKRRNYRPWY